MNTFWLKVAGIVIIALGLIILVRGFLPSENGETADTETESKPTTFYDQAEQDKDEFLAKPEPVEQPQPPAPDRSGTRSEPNQPTVLYFKPLGEIEKVEAERLLNVAVPGRSIGRLPMTGFKLMVDNCREIIRRWPDSLYAYKAKQLLADMPPRYQKRYKVTPQELDTSRFAKPRPGTKPYNVEKTR